MSLSWIEEGQALERLVETGKIDIVWRNEGWSQVKRNRLGRPAALGRLSTPGMLCQNPPHDLCCDSEEVSAVLPADASLLRELQIGLVDDFCGLEPLCGRLSLTIVMSESMNIPVDERNQLVEGLPVAVRPRVKELGHVTGRELTHARPNLSRQRPWPPNAWARCRGQIAVFPRRDPAVRRGSPRPQSVTAVSPVTVVGWSTTRILTPSGRLCPAPRSQVH